jgi:hypothetical protein
MMFRRIYVVLAMSLDNGISTKVVLFVARKFKSVKNGRMFRDKQNKIT